MLRAVSSPFKFLRERCLVAPWQPASMAAEGYYRETGKVACVVVTSGPGVQNLFNGFCGCWYDGRAAATPFLRILRSNDSPVKELGIPRRS